MENGIFLYEGRKGESRQEIKKERTKFQNKAGIQEKKEKEKIVEKGKESSMWDKIRKVKLRKSLVCLEKK